MFYFLLRKSARYTIDFLLAKRGSHLTHVIEPLYYEDLHLKTTLLPGTLVFTDFDRIRSAGYPALANLYSYLSGFADALRVMNDPRRMLSRFALLKKLNAEGINDFQIRAATEDLSTLRMPVYLRSALGHNPFLSGLLHDQKNLRRTILEKRALGHRPDEMYVIEFCDTSDGQGIFTKYSALKIGDQILPRHANFDTQWIVKSSTAKISQDLQLAHRDHIDWYFSTDPHQAWLRNVCQIAGLDYGRIDYGVLNGKPQLWEINTNPSYGSRHRKDRSDAYQNMEEPHRLAFFGAFFDAIVKLAEVPSGTGEIVLHPAQGDILTIQKHLEIPEEEMKESWPFVKVANSKKPWVLAIWNIFLNGYAILLAFDKKIRIGGK